jgi:hypothetical protein
MGPSRSFNLVVAGLVSALALVPATAATSADWQSAAQRQAHVLADVQNPNGTFPPYNFAHASGVEPYGESMVGYGLIEAGLADGNVHELHAGLRAVDFAAAQLLRRGSPSVFENLALAASYSRVRSAAPGDPEFAAIRPRLERALRAIRPVWSGSGRRYFNKYLVEAVAWLELEHSGLRSTTPGTVLAAPGRARKAVALLVNRRIGSRRLGFEYTGTGERRALILSDLPWNPAAYQGLSLGMYARAIKLLGSDASPRAWQVLRTVANASWELTGPDGDLAYYGRSQEEAWALGLTAYGAEVATQGASADQTSRFRALAARALQRLEAAHPVGPKGLWITPATAQDLGAAKQGLDRYADSVAFSGLALVATNWAASVENSSGAGLLAADRESSYIVGQDRSRIALVRTPSLWFAVKQARSDKIDLRYDFGLVSMKSRDAAGAWHDVIPAPAKVQGRPDSAGPALRTPYGPAYAMGTSMRVARGGVVKIRGWFATAAGKHIRRAWFRFAPAGACVTLSFALRRGERAGYSAFVRRVARRSRAGVVGGGERVTLAPAAQAMHLDRHGYSSGSDARLRRVRFALAGAGVKRVTTCSGR